MAEGPGEGWRSDPYRRHPLRYWDGLAWTAYVSDGGETGDDPVFPIPAPEADARDYLTTPRPRRRPLRHPHRVVGLDRAAAWAIIGFVAVVVLAAISARDGGAAPAARSPRVAGVEAAAAQVPRSAAAALAGLAVRTANRTPIAPHPARADDRAEARTDDRTDGDRADPAGDSCAVDQAVLRRDLVDVTLAADGCTVRSGLLRDPATGRTISYTRDRRPPTVVVDRVVSPEAAWRTGAARRTPAERAALAADPLNLLALSAGALQAKGTSDAAGWLPANRTGRCAYAARQIAVKVRYDLWVTPAELSALRAALSTCPDEPLPS